MAPHALARQKLTSANILESEESVIIPDPSLDAQGKVDDQLLERAGQGPVCSIRKKLSAININTRVTPRFFIFTITFFQRSKFSDPKKTPA
jgi:hypothetical protein